MAVLIAPNTQKYDIGRCALFYQPVWSTTTDLFPDFIHAGNSEGDVTIAVNGEYSELTLTETSGPAAIKRYLSGEKPTFELGIFPSEVARLALFSPTGKASSGQQRRRSVREFTLWLVPEDLFLKPNAVTGVTTEVAVTFAAGAWLKDGIALTTEEQRLRDLSLIIWRADFSRATPVFHYEDGGKAHLSVTVNVQQDLSKPDGCQNYLVLGEIADFPTIDFEPEP
jgi:hypothetical protein